MNNQTASKNAMQCKNAMQYETRWTSSMEADRHYRWLNRPKNVNDLGDLDFDLVTLRSWGHVDLVYTYLPYEYGDDRGSLRQSNVQKRKWPWWPWLWPCDLEVMSACWPCLYLPTIWIWWWSGVIKVVLGHFPSLTLKGQYLTLRAKIQNSGF